MNKIAFDQLLRVLYDVKAKGLYYNQNDWRACALGHCAQDAWFQENFPGFAYRQVYYDVAAGTVSILADAKNVFGVPSGDCIEHVRTHVGWLFGGRPLHEASVDHAILRVEKWLQEHGHYDNSLVAELVDALDC